MRTAIVKREALGGELRTVGVVAAERARAGPDQHPVLGLGPEAARLRDGRARSPRPGAGDHLQPGRAAGRAGDAGRAGLESRPAPATRTRSHEHDAFTGALDANARRRLELLGISAQEIDEVLQTGKAVEAIAIRSPVDGYVVGKNAVAGVAVQPGTVLFEVADLSQVWVTADIYEQDISRIRVGQRGAAGADVVPGRDAHREGAVHLPGARLGQPHAARAAGVQEQIGPQRAPPATRDVRHGLLGPAGDDRPDGARRGGGRHGRDALPVRREGGRPLRAARR